MKTAIAWLLVILVISIAILPHSFVAAKSKDSKAKDAIIKAIGRSVEGKYSTIDMVNISKKNDNATITVYNITQSSQPPRPPVPPTPNPTPTGTTTKVCLVGDLKGSTVPNLMKGCNLKIGLGDLGYASDLSYFKGLHFDKCVIGNHDATEDGSSAIYKEALSYCGDHWSLKTANGTVLLIGMNTNGNPSDQVSSVQLALSGSKSIKTIVLLSHKGGHVPPNSHHPAEAASLYKQLEAIVPTNVKLIEVFGHNHQNSASDSMNWYEAGAGGKSFYSCGVSSVWNFCDNTHEAYLELTIDNSNGNTVAHFISDGKILH